MLSNSNQRGLKGFTPTFFFNRDWKVARFKLDWIFVKPYETEKNNKKITRLKPFYGRTLRKLNHSLSPPISDHVPITVDLPLNPPDKKEVKKMLKKLKKQEK